MNKVVSLFSVLVLVFGLATAALADAADENSQPMTAAAVESVNINTADVEALAEGLHRVGPKTAQAIVDWRQSNGDFTSKDQLLEVKGVGEAILKANSDRIVL